jgi:Flp pilus assembly protein TadD
MQAQASHRGKKDTSVLQAKLWHQAGLNALASDRLEDAVRSFRQAVQLNPRNDSAWNDLGVVMEALGNPMEAMGCYKQVLAHHPDHAQARANLGMLWVQVKMAGVLSRQAFSANAA